MTRQTGKTTAAILAAPKNAYFVWVNENLSYPIALARSLERIDIKVVGPSFIKKLIGIRGYSVVLDPDTRLNHEEWFQLLVYWKKYES